MSNEIKILTDENKKMSNEIKILTDENKKMSNEIDRSRRMETFKKLIVAIQDLNRLEKLEIKIDPKYIKSLQKLRDNRNFVNHYIYDGCTNDEINDKIAVLIEKIKNMPMDIKKMFDIYYPNVIKAITDEISRYNLKNSHAFDLDIDLWWDM
jgi:hypothetical protein